jgi:FixJ family two-component response regulator
MQSEILIVDADHDVCWLLAELLRRRGYAVVTFEEDHEVLAYLAEADLPRCIVVDARKPPIDGRALHDRLREEPALERVPIILVGDRAHVETGVDHVAVLRRPLRLHELYAALDHHAASEPRHQARARSSR